jgi:murein L,D-transpeptidase YafK
VKRRVALGLMAAGCRRPAADPADGWPANARSLAAIARVRPRLEARLAALGSTWGAWLYLRAHKRERELEVWVGGADQPFRLFQAYAILAASGSLGPKRREGDRQVPEGCYHVTAGQLHPASRYHLALNLGYPNTFDRALGRTGSAIMIHGDQASIGCLAMGDAAIEEIYALADAALRAGQPEIPVHLFPFRGDAAPAEPPTADAAALWSDLLPVWRAFASTRRPPRVEARNGHYAIVPDESSR